MSDVRGKFKVKVKATLRKKDPDTGEVISTHEIPEHVITDPKLVKKLREEGVVEDGTT